MKNSRNIRVKYEALDSLPSLQICVWEEDNKLHFSWYYPFINKMKRNQVNDGESEISVNLLNQKICYLGDDSVITKSGKRSIDPVSYSLRIINSDGKEIIYNWSEEDIIPAEIKNFIAFIGDIIGETPFTL